MLAGQGRAPAAGLALVAWMHRVAEVPAPGALEQVPADGRHVAQLAGRAGEHGLGQRRVAAPDLRVGGEVTVGDRRADLQGSVVRHLDPVEGE
jgi:hypothetical protein